ncbi:MAG: hypothetical protein HY903_15285 [Deltaproteobacteria bacterium]|nr:hypothetical protein [Deltaproteobacteria bacterium]
MRSLVTACAVLLSASACGELPDPPLPDGNPGGQPAANPGDPPPPEDPALDPNAPPPASPALAALPSRYGYDTIPVRGTAAPNETVFAEGGSAPVATDADAGGRFCLDVPLAAKATQTVEVFVQDQRGVTSSPAAVVIVQDPTLAVSESPPRPQVNLAARLPLSADETPKAGVFANLTDEDTTSSVTVPRAIVWLDFSELADIESVEVVFSDTLTTGDNTFATEYQVLVSDVASPSMPPAWDSPDWTLLYDVYPGCGLPAGDGGSDLFGLETPWTARYVAFSFIENNKTDWLSSEEIKVAELRVQGRSAVPPPPQPQTPTCANGKQP